MLKPKHNPTPLIPLSEKEPLQTVPINRPSFFRFWYLFFKFLKVLLVLLWLRLRTKSGVEPKRKAIILRELLEALGGLWLKVGQLLAMRSDLFTTEFCNEMSKLQERAYAFPAEVAKAQIERALGCPIARVFDHYEATPIAAASLAQVHKARLRREGVWVAIKVQKPFADDYFNTDMKYLRRTFKLFILFNIFSFFRWKDMLWELNQMIKEELDYHYEASSMKTLRKSLRAHKIYVPKVFRAYSTRKVLVMEYIHGVTMSDFIYMQRNNPERLSAWLELNGIRTNKVGRRLIHSLLRQIFEDNLFHGDLHPGNIMLLRKGKIALIDLGSVGTSDWAFLAKYHQYLYSLSTKNWDAASDWGLSLSYSIPLVDIQAVKLQVQQVLRSWHRRTTVKSLPFHQKSLSGGGDEINRILFKNRIEIDWAYLKIGRAMGTLDLSLGYIYPNINYAKIIEKYVNKARQRECWQKMIKAVTLPETISNYASVLLPMIREKAMRFAGFSDQVLAITRFFLKGVTFAIWLGVGYLVLGYLHQHHPTFWPNLDDAVDVLGEDTWFQTLWGWVKKMPKLSFSEWILVLFPVLIVGIRFHRMVRGINTERVRLPGNSNSG